MSRSPRTARLIEAQPSETGTHGSSDTLTSEESVLLAKIVNVARAYDAAREGRMDLTMSAERRIKGLVRDIEEFCWRGVSR